jgi:hypothetical protein
LYSTQLSNFLELRYDECKKISLASIGLFVGPSNQCDQIGRNFAILAIFGYFLLNKLDIFWVSKVA